MVESLRRDTLCADSLLQLKTCAANNAILLYGIVYGWPTRNRAIAVGALAGYFLRNMINHPTPHPEVNSMLQELLESVGSILGSHLIGMYLDGSLANGDFDQDSDIDFVAVTDEDISGDLFLALQAVHERLATIDS